MSKSRKRPRPARSQRPGKPPARRASGWFIPLALLVGSIAAIIWLNNGNKGQGLAIVTGQDVEARVATADNAKFHDTTDIRPRAQCKLPK